MLYYTIQMSDKNKITYLDLIIPFCIAYIFMQIIYNLFFRISDSPFIAMITITLLSFILMYGLFYFMRDFSHLLKKILSGIYNILKDILTNQF